MTNIAARTARRPRLCFWEITDACNLRCIHCEADGGVRSADVLTTEEALALCEDLAGAGCSTVNLTGGEPLLRRDWPEIARRLADLGMEVLVITNGTLVDEAMIRRLIDAGVTGVSVSLDGDRETHDTIRVPAVSRPGWSCYDLTVAAIERLAASPLKTAVITQVHRHNLDDLDRMHEQVAGFGVDLWQVQIAMPLGRLLRLRSEYLIEPDQIPTLSGTVAGFIRQAKVRIAVSDNIGYYGRDEPVLRGSFRGRHGFWMGCMAGIRVVAVMSGGDVKGCPSHPRSFAVGNIREQPFGEIWADGSRFAYNTAWRQELLEGGCKSCPFASLCRAGCTTMAFALTGTIYDNPFCIQRAGRP
jgi:radical SAM protein with 4Fe4S-binding SPASM domain